LCNVALALGAARRHKQSIEASLEILLLFGENLPRSSGDKKLRTDLYQIIRFLLSTSDDSIYGMQECSNKYTATLINVYVGLAHVLHYQQPWQVGSVSLRMVELTLKTGLSAKSPLAFAHFGGVLVAEGFMGEGRRLGESYLYVFLVKMLFILRA
jgi:hypothetical protein